MNNDNIQKSINKHDNFKKILEKHQSSSYYNLIDLIMSPITASLEDLNTTNNFLNSLLKERENSFSNDDANDIPQMIQLCNDVKRLLHELPISMSMLGEEIKSIFFRWKNTCCNLQ